MRRRPGALPPIPALVLAVALTAPAVAQTGSGPSPLGASPPPAATPGLPPAPATGRNVTATGKTMPPASGRGTSESKPDPKPDSKLKASTEAEMIKAQKATEARNKAWDAKMRKTMGSICSGC